MGVQDGRVVPGEDLSFEWTTDLEAAKASQADAKKGGVFVWVYAKDDAETEGGAFVQRELFLDHEIRFLARQIPCVKLDRAEHESAMEALGLKTTPALVVLDRKGKVKKRYEGKIKTSKVARTLRGVVPKRRMPKD
jgi:predicted transcriptional regulator